LFINGEVRRAEERQVFRSINPANEQKLAEIALAAVADVDAAYQAARRAYDSVWSKCRAASAPSISSASRDFCRIARGSLP